MDICICIVDRLVDGKGSLLLISVSLAALNSEFQYTNKNLVYVLLQTLFGNLQGPKFVLVHEFKVYYTLKLGFLHWNLLLLFCVSKSPLTYYLSFFVFPLSFNNMVESLRRELKDLRKGNFCISILDC